VGRVRVESSGKIICAERSETETGRLLSPGDSRITSVVLPFVGSCRHSFMARMSVDGL